MNTQNEDSEPSDDPQEHAMKAVSRAYANGLTCVTDDLADLADYLKAEVLDRDVEQPKILAMLLSASTRPF